MKTTAIEAALNHMEACDTGDEAPLVRAAREELAALSSVPEDVAGLVETIGAGISPLAIDDMETVKSARAALSRLALAAARVSGLEADALALAQTAEESEKARITAESERDAARQGEELLTRQLRESYAENERLTTRVAELAKERDEFRDGLQQQREWKVAALARATTAEAERDEWKRKALERAKAFMQENTRAQNAEDALSAPTLAPGLREAVGPGDVLVSAEALLRIIGEHVAQYVFTEHLPTQVQIEQAQDNAAPRIVRKLVEALNGTTSPSTEPTVTHAALAAVVEDVAPEEAPLPSQWVKGVQRWDDFRAGAREVLRRVTGGQVPKVLTEARVVEVLTSVRDAMKNEGRSSPEWDSFVKGRRDAAEGAAHMLGLTLPTGPGGGETSPNTPETVDAARGALGLSTTGMSGWTVSNPGRSPDEPTRRARIPTPTTTNEDHSNDD